VPRLTREQATAVTALDNDPDHIAAEALRSGHRRDQLVALQIWTRWHRDEVARLLDRPRLSPVTQALIAGLRTRVGRKLGRGERGTFELLAKLYRETEDTPLLEIAGEEGLLRVCGRCDLVTRGARNASRCPDCGHRHSARINHEPPRFTSCPVCGIRPVIDARVRCDTCEAERTRSKKAAQARARRARQRDATPPP
jgi:hypothetical protein